MVLEMRTSNDNNFNFIFIRSSVNDTNSPHNRRNITMSPKLYENHTIVTHSWIEGMKKALKLVLLILIILSSAAIMLIGFLIWLLSLGHFHVYRLGLSAWEADESGDFLILGMNINRILPDDWIE